MAKHLLKQTMDASSDPEREIHGRTEVFFKLPDRPKPDTRPLRERKLNKKVMDLKHTCGIVDIKGGQMQFGRFRKGNICPAKIVQCKGDLEWSDKVIKPSWDSFWTDFQHVLRDATFANMKPEYLRTPSNNLSLVHDAHRKHVCHLCLFWKFSKLHRN